MIVKACWLRMFDFVASGVSKDASPDQLKDFIESKGIYVINIEKLTHHPEA
jgi:hypothetical protein